MHVIDQRSAMAIALIAVLLVGCDVDVTGEGESKDVDIRTAFGDISVRTSGEGPDTGLPVYPGARPLSDDDEPEHADVKVRISDVGVNVAAARYESDDAPQAILEFYKDKMSAHGAVVECKGDIEFEGEPRQPVCDEDSSSSETQLVTGTEDKHRLVSVKPRGGGAEFAVVSLEIDKRG
jgi:hypothetical protein